MKIEDKFKKIIEENAIALATTDGKIPHVIAVGYPKVAEDKIILTIIFMKQTIENIKKNNNVSFAVWSRNWEKKCWGYTFYGTAEIFASGKWFDFVCNMKENKGIKPRGALVITINSVKKAIC